MASLPDLIIPEDGNLAANITYFARALRTARVPVGADSDTLDYSALDLDFTFALADPAGSDYDALFTATPDSGGWVDWFADFETVKLSTQDTTLTINGANTLEALNTEAITIDGNTGSNCLDLSGVDQGITVDLGAGMLNVTGGETGMTIQNFENVIGTAQDDTITGDDQANWIDGGAGADVIDDGDGADVLHFDETSAGVTVDLVEGTGLGGDAEGDSYSNIEVLIGADNVDTFKSQLGSGQRFAGGVGNGMFDFSQHNALTNAAKFCCRLKSASRYAMGIFLATFFSATQPALADFNMQPIIIDEVVSVTDYGYIVFKIEGGGRLWGIVPNVAYLRQYVVGNTLNCRLAGEAMASRRTTQIINCSINGINDGGIAEHLMETGNAIEICGESQNWFQTCEPQE